MIKLLLFMIALGFFCDELPRALRRRRDRALAERRRIERETARLALAINLRWEKFGCTRAMSELEQARALARVYGGAVVMLEVDDADVG